MSVHIISTSYRNSAELGPRYTVLVDGEIYPRINKYLLASLRDGMTPAELELEPEGEIEPQEWDFQ